MINESMVQMTFPFSTVGITPVAVKAAREAVGWS